MTPEQRWLAGDAKVGGRFDTFLASPVRSTHRSARAVGHTLLKELALAAAQGRSALAALECQAGRNDRVGQAARRLLTDMQRGVNLPDALDTHPDLFDLRCGTLLRRYQAALPLPDALEATYGDLTREYEAGTRIARASAAQMSWLAAASAAAAATTLLLSPTGSAGLLAVLAQASAALSVAWAAMAWWSTTSRGTVLRVLVPVFGNPFGEAAAVTSAHIVERLRAAGLPRYQAAETELAAGGSPASAADGPGQVGKRWTALLISAGLTVATWALTLTTAGLVGAG